MPLSEARRRGNDKYNAKCDRIIIQPLKAKGTAIRQAAQTAGESLQGYILKAIDDRMQADEQAEEQTETG